MGKLVPKTVFIFAATFFFASNVSCGRDEEVPSLEGWKTHLLAEIRELKAVPPDARDYERIRGRERVFAILDGDLDAEKGLLAVFFRMLDAVEQINFKEQKAQRTRALRTEGL